MANEEHVRILKQGVEVWNKWREKHPEIEPDLSAANLVRANLFRADFSDTDLKNSNLINAMLFKARFKSAILVGSNLRGAQLGHAMLNDANLTEANISDTILSNADLKDANLSNSKLIYSKLNDTDFRRANLKGADLSDSNLTGATLFKADLSDANLNRADLSYSQLVGAKLKRANLLGCRVFGVSTWELDLDGANQTNLIITRKGEPVITVDNLEVAQLIYLLLNNEKIRNIIDTIGQKGVLILGRFIKERKAVLDTIRDRLRKLGFLPMMFDFEKPSPL